MTERLDAMMTRSYQKNGETKTHYTKIGTAWPNQGGGYRLKLEAVPVPTIYDGKVECSILLLPPKPYEGQGSNPQPQAGSVAPNFDTGNEADNIPF